MNDREDLPNLKGTLKWLDDLAGGYIGLAVAFFVLWVAIIFPLALVVWVWPYVKEFLAWLF